MASKSAKAALGGAHTAGIFADMTVDGPEIGTLVVIVDRAKNLPNRKTMGKQDPYCAARLGKEAKKTETDKRGGQTPRWDQELRFTVHDSPDYYQLKVSVFNDDKKTELIGETWVALDKIIIPGGGQNDLWHHLNCKGRFAGEIRIELTYYDTRPKDEQPEAARQDITKSVLHEQVARDGVSGPRQPRPIKRRPLPADPTGSLTSRPAAQEHPQSSPALHTPPPGNLTPSKMQPQYMDQRQDYRLDTTPLSNTRLHHQTHDDRESPINYNNYGQEFYKDSARTASTMEGEALTHFDPYYSSSALERPANVGRSHPELQNEQHPGRSLPYEAGFYRVDDRPGQDYYVHQNQHQAIPQSENGLARPFIQPLSDSYDATMAFTPPSMPQHHSMPDVRPHPTSQGFDHDDRRTSIPMSTSYETPTRHHSLGAEGAWSTPVLAAVDDEGPPPPPPIHRSSGIQSPAQSSGRHSETYPPPSAPLPLNIRPHRGSNTASPLSQVQSNTSAMGYPPSASPSDSQQFSHPATSVSSHTSYSKPGRRNSQNLLTRSPTKDFDYDLPPSLVPGYEPSIADDESQRLLAEKRKSTRQIHPNEASPQYQALPARSSPRTYPSPRNDPFQSPRHDQYASPRTDGHSPLRQLDDSQDRRPHRSSAPVVSDTRLPMRKSVSPAPEPMSGTRRLSAVPFSPDSYDAFNPSVNSAVINSAGPKYNTPEQAKEALREREKELKLEEGPIIGSDGRVIDPSDHLSTDTWAPEPEPKLPRKGPELTLRFRHSPQGAQPMPPSGTRRVLQDTPTRPQPTSTPVCAHSPDTNSAGRNRFFKKSRVSPAQPASSPVIPTVHTSIAPARISVPRASASDYPAHEHDNFYNRGSPTYNMGNLTGGVPPPVPGKIPIAPAQEEWGVNALSEEMRRIDIGVGGQARSRRSRFGA
ncbi:hypothetical protein MMC07_005116 [Pseudocyphellaria aurata]|nr:hypothetical protein [Pseudocyphellaria aurata]